MIEALILMGALTIMLILAKAVRKSSNSVNKSDLGLFSYKVKKTSP